MDDESIVELTILQAIHYILQKIDFADKIKLIKLIYLADKCHAIQHGRTITDDNYYAMAYGPVGSKVKDILTYNSDTLAKHGIEKLGHAAYKYLDQENDYDMLSESDKSAIDLILKHFGDNDSLELIEYTHKYPEWRKHESLFRGGKKDAKRIHPRELLSVLKDDPFFMPKKHIKESKRIISGRD